MIELKSVSISVGVHGVVQSNLCLGALQYSQTRMVQFNLYLEFPNSPRAPVSALRSLPCRLQPYEQQKASQKHMLFTGSKYK
jgi:hypothetical protein